MFWFTTVARYLLAVLAALLLSIIISFLAMLLFSRAGDDSPVLGLFWYFVFLGVGSLLIPLSLGTTAEIVQRRVFARSFRWSCALFRSLLALPIGVGPLYAAWYVIPYIESRRPTHWVEKEFLYCVLSGTFAYFALRVRGAVETQDP
jgi:hypothetical protein